jgi:N-acylneuraminate cytidylyltransferase
MAVAIIPARGGSKRLPGKNIRPFAGKPLLVHSIDVAKRVRAIERILVTTDDAKTAQIAADAGAEVVTRPAELSTDHSTTASAIRHALMTAYGAAALPNAVVTLQPNCPLRPAAMVADAIRRFQEGEADSVVSVTLGRHKLGTIQGGCFVPRYQTGMRSQDMTPEYYENGVIYVSAAAMVVEREDLFGARIAPMVIDELYALGDIDTELDFRVAEFLFHAYRAKFEEEKGSPEDASSGRSRGGNSWTSFG